MNTDTPTAEQTAVYCTHCSLPVPSGLIEADSSEQFCCAGCRSIYQMLHACGLDAFYALREREDFEPEPGRPTGNGYEWFDDDTFAAHYIYLREDGAAQTELLLEGVHCAACIWLIEKLPTVLPGLTSARLNLAQATVQLCWDSKQVKLSRIARALDKLGYPSHPAKGVDRRRVRTKENRKHLVRIAIAGAAAGNNMLLAFALYAGWFSGMANEYELLFRLTSMAIASIALFGPGIVFFRGAWSAIRLRSANLDLPIAFALAAGFITGSLNTFMQRGDVYFDSLTVLVFLLLVGRFVQHLQQRRAADSVELLFSLTPRSARRVEDGGVFNDVPVEALQPGQTIEVRAGETIAVDGEVSQGESKVDLALLTGESRAQPITAMSQVYAGSTNLASPVRVTVRATGDATRVGRLMQLVAACSRQQSPMISLADRVAGWFTLAITLLALGTFLTWRWLDSAHAVDHAIALLIVACPCALGLATPLAFAIAIGRSARQGILVKGAAALEALAQPGVMMIDKTGTLTHGQMRLVQWIGDDALKSKVAAAEATSTHLIARALCDGLNETGTQPQSTVAKSNGLIATFEDGQLLIGSTAFIRSEGVTVDNDWQQQIDIALQEGHTPVLVAFNKTIGAIAKMGDQLRPESIEAIDKLKTLGWSVQLLSGDAPIIAQQIGEQVGVEPCDIFGGMTPEDKLEHVRRATRPTVMVGDGVNDAAALAAASVGVAVHGGAEASLEAADIYLSRPGLAWLIQLVRAAKRTGGVIKRNLWVSLSYNIVGITLAATGLIGPLTAAVLMPISSLSVLWLSWGARTFDED